ncbi:MAG: hypothetical protein FJX04_02025 [Alphaproteobacteria bacterium]|nr:hypothetical protein [Alphaproteobacteria bacterium]
MAKETFSGTAVRVTEVEKLSPGDKLGLLPSDILLKIGKREPLEALEMPSILEEIGAEKEWITVLRDKIIFKVATKGGATGITLEPFPLQEEVNLEVKGFWTPFYSAIRLEDSLLLLPERISALWLPFPIIAYGYFRLWQMMGATIFMYGLGYATSTLGFIVVYIASIIILAMGGPKFLRDTAVKDGFLPRARIALADLDDAAKLEMTTGAILRLDRDKNKKR